MAAQDFRHATQHKGESVSDFIRRVEQLFKLVYGKDEMSEETRGTLLHGQLQEDLIYDIMKAPAVSGCRGYKELCLAARNEEKRLIELAKRQQYHSHATPSSNPDYSLHRRPGSQTAEQTQHSQNTPPPTRWQVDRSAGPRRCFNCGKLGHLSWECRARRMESSGRGSGGTRPGDTRQIQTTRMDGASSMMEEVSSNMRMFSWRASRPKE